MPLKNIFGSLCNDGSTSDVLLYSESRGSLSRGELVEASRKAGALLEQVADVRPGDTVCICADDGPGSVLAVLGAWSIGAVPTLVNRGVSDADLEYVLHDSNATCAVIDRPDDAVNAVSCLQTAELDVLLDGITGTEGDDRYDWCAQANDQVALIQYTSGSTGRPKGVVHRHRGLLALVCTTGPLYALKKNDVILSGAKITFGYGLGNTVLLPWISGAASCLIEREIDVFSYMDAVHRWKPTVLAGVPRLWAGMVNAADCDRSIDLGSVRLGISAGELLPQYLAERVAELFGVPVIDGFGGTEILHIVMARHPGDGASFPLTGVEISLRDEDGRRIGGEGSTTGRLHVRSNMVADGYINRPNEQAKAFDGLSGVYTGDIFERTESGGFQWVSRSDDMLLLGGFRVAAHDIETIVSGSLHVQESAVVAVTRSDGLQDAIVFVTPPPMVDDQTCATGARKALANGLDVSRRPSMIRVVNSLPVTVTGKLDRNKLRSIANKVDMFQLKLNELKSVSKYNRTILVIPCAGGLSTTYRDLAEALPDEVRLLSADMEGQFPESFECVVDCWRNLIRQTLRTGDVVVGHSLGAAVLAEIVGNNKMEDKLYRYVLVSPLTRRIRFEGVDMAHWMLDHGLITNEVFLDRSRRDIAVSRFVRDLHLIDDDYVLKLPISRARAKVIIGGDDRILLANGIDKLYHAVDRENLIVVPGAGHRLPIDQPEVFVAAMKNANII